MVKKDGTVAESELKAAGFMVVKRIYGLRI